MGRKLGDTIEEVWGQKKDYRGGKKPPGGRKRG